MIGHVRKYAFVFGIIRNEKADSGVKSEICIFRMLLQAAL